MNYPSYGTDNIGIIGQGFVGTALREGLKKTFTIETYDKFVKENSTCETLKELCEKTFILFLCLPTPMKRNGSCDLSILEEVVKEVDAISSGDHIVVVKSTVPPGTTKKFNERYTNIKVVFSPEFLTEANSINDFKNQTRIIVGGPRPASTILKICLGLLFQKFLSSKLVQILQKWLNISQTVFWQQRLVLRTK